ncbi:MAG TPA: tRNA uridine-5-carboxymethylaminomethyl(34) synthesis GTPase MnmE, partial [Gammaproteobacteria bacterium]|nr:tRNA uridine-5-carboxymethylaminomethyl(34) synthesis GTPase MnmE [Gammaproteobacteria bacterium]
QFPSHLSRSIIFNKIDIAEKSPTIVQTTDRTEIFLSAKDNLGISLLIAHLKSVMGYHGESEGLFISRRRHLEALEKAKNAVETGYQQIKQHKAGELLAEDLRQAQIALNEITGEFDNEDLLGEIFSSFCIGK